MKKFIVSFIFCLLFVLIGNGINAKAALEKDVEGKATELKANKKVSDKLNSTDEEKWFKFEVKETGTQQFSLEHKDNGTFWYVIYYVDDDKVLQQVLSVVADNVVIGNKSPEFSFEKGTILYANVSAHSDVWISVEAVGKEYIFSCNTTTDPVEKCVWATKDADKEQDANVITSNNRLCSISNYAQDDDWYKYEVKNDDPFSFYAKSTGTDGGNRLVMEIYEVNKKGELVQKGEWGIPDGEDGFISDKIKSTKGTIYYVKISNPFGDGTGVRYIITVNDTASTQALDTPYAIMAGTNIIVGKADPYAKVSVKYGTKTYTATADADGIYRVKTAKLKKGKNVTIWQTVNELKSEKTTVKVVNKY